MHQPHASRRTVGAHDAVVCPGSLRGVASCGVGASPGMSSRDVWSVGPPPDVAEHHLCWCSFKAEKKFRPDAIDDHQGSVRNGEIFGRETVAVGQ